MSGSVSNADLAGHLEALRRDQRAAGAELQRLAGEVRRLADQHDDHERRIAVLEPLRSQMDRLTEHLSEIGGTVTAINERLLGTERSVAEALRVASRELASQVTATVRAELHGLRDDMGEMNRLLRERPCVPGAECPEGEKR